MPRTIRALAERQTLGRRIRAHRIALGLSHRDIAAHIGAGKASVYYVDTAVRDVYTGTLIDVAAAVGLEVALVADYHLPLLNLTADELDDLLLAAEAGAASLPNVPTTLRSALDKLTTTEETPA